jgi:hypothetical protein
MKGFLIVSGMLVANLFLCGASFFSQQTGIVLVAFIMLFPLIWAHGYVSGKSVEIQSPVRPRNSTPAMSRNVAAPRSLKKLSMDEQI